MINWECFENLNFSKNSVKISKIFGMSIGLVFLNFFVIFGNFLVIFAVFRFKKLRNIPNLMISSLALTDLLLGILVLPFSTANQLLGIWIFDDIWCQIWLLIDVLLCTASIYCRNLKKNNFLSKISQEGRKVGGGLRRLKSEGQIFDLPPFFPSSLPSPPLHLSLPSPTLILTPINL